ncbi:MAG: NAD(+)/NADH kinase [Eubacteriales bacterium]|nr:NAD(+)/NADH kinase [Eubacteriales bacterium]
MNQFFIVTNNRKDKDGRVTNRILSFLEAREKKCFVCDDDLYNREEVLDIPEGIDLVIVIGGDGTMIGAVGSIQKSIPVLGVNMGTLGYLTEVEIDRVEDALQQVLEGDYVIEERMMLDGIFDDGEKKAALNEIVVSRKGVLRLLQLNVYVNGALLNTYEADGIIISTPTGSTAYNLSAGGPIVEPTASMIVITPICSHALNTSSIVLSADDEIRIEMGEERHGGQGEFNISFDGKNMRDIVSGQSITIKKSDNVTKLMKLSEISFLEILRKKMKGN